MWALVALPVGLSPRRHGRACPGYPRRQRFKDGADMGRGPQQSFAGTRLSPLPRSRTFDAPNRVDSRDNPRIKSGDGHDPLKLVRRFPQNPDSDDQQLTRQEPQCARDRGRWFTWRVRPFRMGGVGGPVEATQSGPSRRGPGRPNFVGRIIQGGTQSGRSQAARVLCAMRVSLNTFELAPSTGGIPPESHRFVTRITARPQKSSIG
jgi:hypothetical protein